MASFSVAQRKRLSSQKGFPLAYSAIFDEWGFPASVRYWASPSPSHRAQNRQAKGKKPARLVD